MKVLEKEQSDNNISLKDADIIEKLAKRYVISDEKNESACMDRLINKVLNHKGPMNLTKILTCHEKVPYANKDIHALKWLMNVIEEVAIINIGIVQSTKEKITFYLKHILKGRYGKDANDDYVSFSFQTANNSLINLLDIDSEEAVIKELTIRHSPENHQRRDLSVELSEKQVASCEKILGEFKNSIMTIDELKDICPETVILGDEKMGRDIDCSVIGNAISGTHVTTFVQFVKFIRDNPSVEVLVDISNTALMYIAKTTLLPKFRKFKHFWAFSRATVKEMCDIDEKYTPVTHILPLYEYMIEKHVFFAIKKPKLIKPIGDCCFSSYLVPEYQRTCGAVFEQNNKNYISVPDGPIALGSGVSVKNDLNEFTRPIFLKMNGLPVTITHLL